MYPLTADGEIVLALPFARRALADSLGAARSVALVASDGRLVLRGWSPVAAMGRVAVRADCDGHEFAERLLDEELRRHPPSRLLADSLIQRREHWWYIPRLLCTFSPSSWDSRIGRRDDPRTTGLLAWEAADGLHVDTVSVPDPSGEAVVLRSLAGGGLSGAADPACLLLHDFSVPDFEQRSELLLQGRLEGDRLVVERRRGRADLPPAAGALRRWRALRTLAQDCQREIARARQEAATSEPPGTQRGR